MYETHFFVDPLKMLPDIKNADVGVNILSDQSMLQIYWDQADWLSRDNISVCLFVKITLFWFSYTGLCVFFSVLGIWLI